MTAKHPLLQVVGNRRMLAILFLGFASGLPLFLTSRTLQAWMTEAGVDLTTIGLFSLVALPYSLKFLWSPLMDRFVPPFLGRRRGWLVMTQIALGLAIAAMAIHNPQTMLVAMALNALLIAFLSASQDIVFDAYRVDVLETWELGMGAATAILGYRGALLLTGGAALALADRLPWPLVYVLLGVLMALCTLITLTSPEPTRPDVPPATLEESVVLPFQDFFSRFHWQKGILILLFVFLYRLGDAFVNVMVTPFLIQTGFSKTDIGAIQGGMGLIATIVGLGIGGAVLSQIGINRSLWVFGGFQALSNLAYFLLAQVGQPDRLGMVWAINIENLCSGIGTAGLVAFMMSLCNHRFSATQYALLSSLMAVSRDLVVAPSGRLAENLGWPGFFLFTLIAALPGLGLLPFFAPWGAGADPDFPRPGSEEEPSDRSSDGRS